MAVSERLQMKKLRLESGKLVIRLAVYTCKHFNPGKTKCRLDRELQSRS